MISSCFIFYFTLIRSADVFSGIRDSREILFKRTGEKKSTVRREDDLYKSREKMIADFSGLTHMEIIFPSPGLPVTGTLALPEGRWFVISHPSVGKT